MSFLDPPSFAQRKRKRSLTTPSQPPPSQDTIIINPRSHSPGTIYQFAFAGLSHTDEDPSKTIRDFPHRGLDGGSAPSSGELDPGGDESDPAATKTKPPPDPRPKGPFEVLLQSVHHFLDQAEIRKAARAYGLLLQLRPRGRPVDVRRHGIWAMGAEIIMREGEDQQQQQDHASPRASTTRWGSAANINKLKAYFDALIQQHPYDYKHPRSVSALDFWLALLACEVYNAHAEHVLALERVAAARPEWDDDDASYESLEGFKREDGEREARARRRREELRVQALATMRDVARRMDGLMRDQPYAKNRHFLRLRAMASLYIADLLVPQVDVLPLDLEEARRKRLMEQHTAKESLGKILENGGELDDAAMAILAPNDGEEDEEDSSLPLYSSLPIRGL